VKPIRSFAVTLTAATALLVTAAATATGAQPHAVPAGTSLSATTVAGIHNTYNRADYAYLAQSLDAGASMIELDTWTDVVTNEWKVGHSNPFGNDNNCVDASTAAQLYTGGANKDLGSCLDDVRVWLAAHPKAGPIYIKVELKNGFEADLGMGPSQFDSVVAQHLGSALYKPADLLAGKYATLNAAATANAWPARSALAGKALVYAIPGTVEDGNPFDHLHTDVEYATYLKNLAAAGKVSQASTFPCVLGAEAGDPRTQYTDTSIRPWFVFFDGDAKTYVTSVDTSWYDTHHYVLVMTDAQNVAPALDDTNPPVADAQARIALLAKDHASVVSSDWYGLPAAISTVTARG
jgi:hypothetical protein